VEEATSPAPRDKGGTVSDGRAVLPWVQATSHFDIQISPSLPDVACRVGGMGNNK